MIRRSRTVTSDIGRPLRLRIAKRLIVREAQRQHRKCGRDVLIEIGHAITVEDDRGA